MAVQAPANAAGDRYRQETENPVEPAEHFVPVSHKSLPVKVVFKAVNVVLRRAIAEFEPPKPFVPPIAPTESAFTRSTRRRWTAVTRPKRRPSSYPRQAEVPSTPEGRACLAQHQNRKEGEMS